MRDLLGNSNGAADRQLMATSVDMKLLEEVLAEIRPVLQGDGGDLILRDIDEGAVATVELLGACGTCPLQIITLAAGIEVLVQRRVPGIAGVITQSATLPSTEGVD